MIRVAPKREFLPHFVQLIFLQCERKDLFLAKTMIQRLPQGPDDHRVAAVIDIIAIISDAVDADDIGLVFDGPGL